MADTDVTSKISVNTSAAVAGLDAINQALKQTNDYLKIVADSTKKVEKATDSYGESALHLNAALELVGKGMEAFRTVFDHTFSKFLEADNASQKLASTLRLLGEKDAVTITAQFEEFATAMEESTNVQDDTTISMIAMAKAMGLTNDQAKKLVQTSADLSAVNGNDVKSSFNELISTYKGVGRGVLEYDKAVAGLSEAQLRNGAAVDLLSKKYAGFAKEQTKTLGGQLQAVRNLFEKTLEDVGHLFSDFFRLDDQSRAIASLKAVREFVNGPLRDTLMVISFQVGKFVQMFTDGFNEITDKASLLKAALVPLGAAAAVAFGPAVLAWLGAFAAELAAAAASALILTAQMLAVAAAVSAVAATIEIVYLNFQNLDKLGIIVVNSLILGFRKIVEIGVEAAKAILDAFMKLWEGLKNLFSAENLKALFTGGKGIGEVLAENIKKSFETAFAQVGKSSEELTKEINENAKGLDFGVTGKAVQGLNQFASGFNKTVKDTVISQVALTGAVNKTREAYTGLSIEGQKALDDLKKKVLDLETARVTLSKNEVDISKAKIAQELSNISALEKELKNKSALNAEGIKLLAQARAIAMANATTEVDEKRKKALDEILEKNKDLELSINSSGKTQFEIIDLQLKRQLELIAKKEEELRIQGLLTDEVKAGLDAQRADLGKAADQAKSNAPNPVGEALSNAGAEGAKAITGAFAPMMGAISGVGAYVAAAQAVVDAGPALLDSITHLIDSITDLPMKLVSSLGKLVTSAIKFVTDFIPNLLKAIPMIIKELIRFLKEIPKAFGQLLAMLPDLIMDLLNQLPDLIKDLVTSLLTYLPKIAMQLVAFLIKDGPKIALAIAWAIGVELPKAIIGGIWDAIKILAKGIAGIFSGKGFSLFNTKDLKKQVADVAKEISASASRLFQVTDLANATKDAKSIVADVQAAGKDVIQKILTAFKWVWENIIKPIWDIVTTAWRWVWDNVLAPIWNMIVGVWRWVWDNVLKPLFDGVVAVFQWVWDKIFKPIIDGITAVFQWVWDKVFKPVLDGIGAVFQWVWDKIFKPIIDGIFAVFQWVWDKIFKPILDTFKAIFDGIGAIFKPILDGASKIGEAIWKPIKDGFDSISNFFSDMVDKVKGALGLGGGGGGGVIGKVVGGLESAGKAIGKAFGFADGGIVPGMASAPGNNPSNDSVLSWLSPGEAVINRELMANENIAKLIKAVMSQGSGFDLTQYLLDLVRAQSFADGGVVGLGDSAAANLGGIAPRMQANGGTVINYNIVLTAKIDNKGEPITADYVKARIMPAIKNELKTASLRGEYILNTKGLRDA